MTIKLDKKFRRLRGKRPEAILEWGIRTSKVISPEKDAARLEEERRRALLEEIMTIQREKKAGPRHVALHTLQTLGHNEAELANHYGVGVLGIRVNLRHIANILGRPVARKPLITNQPENFSTFADFINRINEVSTNISTAPPIYKASPKRVSKPTGGHRISWLARRVLLIAPSVPRKQDGRYNVKEIALVLDEKPRLISSCLEYLKRRGLMPQSHRVEAKIMREPTEEDVKAHIHLVHQALRRHKILRGAWWNFVQRQEAERLGKSGLIKGLQRYDTSKGNKEGYIKMWIAREIAREANIRRRQAMRERSLDAPAGAHDERQLYEKVPAPEPPENIDVDPALRKIFQKHQARRIRGIHALIVGLLLKGHNQSEIGRHFKVTRQNISQIQKRIAKRIGSR